MPKAYSLTSLQRISPIVFVVGAATALWVAARGADQLLQAFRIIPRLDDVSAGVWLLLMATFTSIVLSLSAILLSWRALNARRPGALFGWAVAGAVLSPALVEIAAVAAERL